MKRSILAAMAVALASCSGPGLSEYQNSCETQHRKFPMMVECLVLTVKNDWKLLSHHKNSDLVGLYLLHAENLSKKVLNRKITAGEAISSIRKVHWFPENKRITDSDLNIPLRVETEHKMDCKK
jgi:hypothetical protein